MYRGWMYAIVTRINRDHDFMARNSKLVRTLVFLAKPSKTLMLGELDGTFRLGKTQIIR